MEYRIGDIVCATSSFELSHIFAGDEYEVVDVLPLRETVYVDVPTHRDGKIEVWFGFIEYVRHKPQCMFK